MTKAGCVLLGAGVVAAFAVGFWAGGGICPSEPKLADLTASIQKVDTLVIYDTIVREKPVYAVSRTRDTLVVRVSDTVRVESDSVVEIVREERVYEDSLYRAVVSGWRPSLDSIAVFPRTSIVTLYYDGGKSRKSRWGLGLQAGYGGTSDGFSPYIGVGISYNILTW